MSTLTINWQNIDAVYNWKWKGYTYTYNWKQYTDASQLRNAMWLKAWDSYTASAWDKTLSWTVKNSWSNNSTTTTTNNSSDSTKDIINNTSAEQYKDVDTTTKSWIWDLTTKNWSWDVSNFTSDPSTSSVTKVSDTDKDYTESNVSTFDQGNRNYKADLNLPENKSRLDQMKNNLKNEAEENPKAYEVSKEQFLKNHHADERDASQVKVLEDAWNNYNKLWLTSDENAVADAAAEVAKNEANDKINASIKNMNDKKTNLDSYVSKMMPEYQSYIDRYEDNLAKYLDEINELKEMQKQYYAIKKNTLMQQAAWNMASVASKLSAQWLSSGAIAGAQNNARIAWDQQYTNLREEHIKTLKDLSQSWADMYNKILNSEKWITDEKSKLLNDYYTSINSMLDDIEDETKTGISNYYNPYKTITNSKVSSVAEAAWAWAKKEDVSAQYKSATAGSEKRQAYIRDYIKTYFWEDANVSDYLNYIKQASSYDNINDAMEYLKSKKESESKKTSNTQDTSWKNKVSNYKSYSEFVQDYPNVSEAQYIWAWWAWYNAEYYF